MDAKQQEDFKQLLIARKWINTPQYEDPLVCIWFSDLVDLIDQLKKL